MENAYFFLSKLLSGKGEGLYIKASVFKPAVFVLPGGR
jgi:hypothetical protein